MTTITNLHLLTFIDRLDSIRENLHLRTLTDREVQDIIEGGFKTTTSGVYNPVNYPDRWRNAKGQNYSTKRFEFNYGHHLTVICDKERSKKFKLKINCAQIPLFYKGNLQICQDVGVKGITLLGVMKSLIPIQRVKKLQIILECIGINTQTVNINTNLYSREYAPINVKLWIKRNILSKLGVFIPIKDKIRIRVSDGSYLYNDVGSISDIEMLDIIKDVEMVDGIRQVS